MRTLPLPLPATTRAHVRSAAFRGNAGQHAHTAAMGARRNLCQSLNAELGCVFVQRASRLGQDFHTESRWHRRGVDANATAFDCFLPAAGRKVEILTKSAGSWRA